ncbi:hypothetical protein OG900_31935 [Streptomyces sp. NBC_00433]
MGRRPATGTLVLASLDAASGRSNPRAAAYDGDDAHHQQWRLIPLGVATGMWLTILVTRRA